MKIRIVVVLLTGLLPALAQAGFFRCTIDGQTVYQASPCPEGTGGVVELKPINSLGGKPAAAPRAPRPASAVAVEKPARKEAAGRPEWDMQQFLGAGSAARASGTYDSGSWYAGAGAYRQAAMESGRTGAPLLVFFYTDWCGYCKHVQAKVFPDARVARALRGYVKLRINPEHSPEDDALFKRMGGRGYPYALVWAERGTGLQPFRFGRYEPQPVATEFERLLALAAR